MGKRKSYVKRNCELCGKRIASNGWTTHDKFKHPERTREKRKRASILDMAVKIASEQTFLDANAATTYNVGKISFPVVSITGKRKHLSQWRA